MSVGVRWSGAVLCGGASRRMGRDKALLEIDGQPMFLRVADAARAAGAAEIVTVGGDLSSFWPRSATHPQLSASRTVADRYPGEGPLGGVLTALGESGDAVVFVVACDLVAPSPEAMAATVAALDVRADGDVAVPAVGGIPQWHHAAWRRRAGPSLSAVFAAGERSIHAAVAAAGLVVVRVAEIDPTAVADADTPGDLPGSALGGA